MSIAEKIIRRNQQDLIDIGTILETFYNSEAGEIVRSIINEIIQDSISQWGDNVCHAEKRLGRAEGVQRLRTYIEMAIAEKNNLVMPIENT